MASLAASPKIFGRAYTQSFSGMSISFAGNRITMRKNFGIRRY